MKIIAVMLIAITLEACASSMAPQIERPRLPAAPANFGMPVALPQASAGKRLDVFALENRKAAAEANRRLAGDGAFYRDVRREFGE